jgi:hypothetical protein
MTRGRRRVVGFWPICDGSKAQAREIPRTPASANYAAMEYPEARVKAYTQGPGLSVGSGSTVVATTDPNHPGNGRIEAAGLPSCALVVVPLAGFAWSGGHDA